VLCCNDCRANCWAGLAWLGVGVLVLLGVGEGERDTQPQGAYDMLAWEGA